MKKIFLFAICLVLTAALALGCAPAAPKASPTATPIMTILTTDPDVTMIPETPDPVGSPSPGVSPSPAVSP